MTESGRDDRPDADLEILTGLRSGKRSYYPEYIRSAERLEQAVQALDGISRALVRTAAGPRTLVEWVVRTATAHLQADWLLFVVADGRHRSARELHVSVTQSVLSIGMTIEVCRAELESLGGRARQIAGRLSSAKDLTRHAAEQLRAAIYSLHHIADEAPGPLPVMMRRLSTVHQPAGLSVKVVLEGRPVPLPAEGEQSMLRWTGEALFNAVAHGKATRALVRLCYLTDTVIISVSDNGTGDPAQLRRALRVASGGDLSGLHRGLANMLDMADDLGGMLSIRRSRIGGVLVRLGVPLPLPACMVSGRGGRPTPLRESSPRD